uniref:Ig-like domain-containing protein n=2 Tax=Pyxicephalus adspersus TaxID=30357 RepID=A0AAV2ZM04_PYXAD|nr:TPA: hypothetical protein GDO54_004055 [Pyxicephalus adspersus]
MLITLGFLIYLPYSLSQSITQEPPFLVLGPGQPVSMTCGVMGISVPTILWYRQGLSGGSLTFITQSVTTGSVEKPTLTHFTAERNNGSHFNLRSTEITDTDSGVYYCAWSSTEAREDGDTLQKPLVKGSLTFRQLPFNEIFSDNISC